jgi:hypothetical protein
LLEKEYFNRPITLDITVASIGINKEEWYCYKPGMTREEVRNEMSLKKYDIVPIIYKNGILKSYFTLDQNDNTKLVVNTIQSQDRLYYLTHVRDAIWKMNKEKKTHFFLSNNHDKNDIVGLLSISNYNCRKFYVYLFSIISYIEREFAALISSDKITGFSILRKLSLTKDLRNQLKFVRERFVQDLKNDTNNDYKEYLYLHHLIWLVKEEKKYKELNYNNVKEFESRTGKLRELRNNIAHPVKSVVRNLEDLNFLEIGLNKLYEFKERLDIYHNHLTPDKITS